MNSEIKFDDSNFWALVEALSWKERRRALKGGMRQAANKVRRAAIRNLRGSGLRVGKDMEKDIRQSLYDKIVGFRIAITTKKGKRGGQGESGMHSTRKGIKKPILLWAEGGTESRETRSSEGRSSRFTQRKRAKHSTGAMRAYEFMKRTEEEQRPQIESYIQDMIINNTIRVAKRYGCK